ncbi:MAG: hypothetical protein WCK03_02205 [Candidatus Taylorbacteria bacterium]
MEKLPHEEYRDNLAEKLKEIRNSEENPSDISRAKAQGYLDAKKETKDYEESKRSHKNDLTPKEKEQEQILIKKEEEIAINKFMEGLEVGEMRLDVAREKIEELNKSLRQGEKQWRPAYKEEWLAVLKPFVLAKENGLDEEHLNEILKQIRQKYNLKSGIYWTGNLTGTAGLSGVGYMFHSVRGARSIDMTNGAILEEGRDSINNLFVIKTDTPWNQDVEITSTGGA